MEIGRQKLAGQEEADNHYSSQFHNQRGGQRRDNRRHSSNNRRSRSNHKDQFKKNWQDDRRGQHPAAARMEQRQRRGERSPSSLQGKANGAIPKQTKSAGMVFSNASKNTISSNMLPSNQWSIDNGMVNFQGEGFVSSFPTNLPDEKSFKNREILYPVRPSLIVDSLDRPTLPEPSRESHPLLVGNPWLHLKPIVAKCSHHYGGGEGCHCTLLGMTGLYHRATVVPDTCVRKGFMKPADLAVEPQGLQLQENPSRFYRYKKEANNHLHGLPYPFLLGGQWPAKAYEPAMAQEGNDIETRLYYTMYNSQRFRQVAETYSRPPTEWSVEENPIIREPSPKGELGKVAKGLFGLETLQRVGFPFHPCAEPRILLFCAMTNKDRRTPVYYTDKSAPLRLDAAITEILRPWYDRGQGKVVCSICLVKPLPDGPYTLLRLTRSEYISHWEHEHCSALMASTVFSGTQLHSRIHVGHLAYVLALAHRQKGKEDPMKFAISSRAMAQFGISEMDPSLRDFLGPTISEEEMEENLLTSEEGEDKVLPPKGKK